MLITTMWYTRREQSVQIGLWYTANGLGIALGGLLGYGIGQIKGIPNGGISNFGTLIIKGLGYSTLVTHLMQIPYGVLMALAFWPVCTSTTDSKTDDVYLSLSPCNQHRWSILSGFRAPRNSVARLICHYLTGSINAAFVLILSMQIANTAGASATCLSLSVLDAPGDELSSRLMTLYGNIAGPFFYKTSQALTYELGIWSMIVCHLLEVVLISTLGLLLRWDEPTPRSDPASS
ncbi:putative MFS allantoate transporter [Aspergillus saccharolyticus JOP 1030-1]|uniref:MFS general substrate transporter n=1 Tax=Aspergillus saccharolyticus JOP 1030-1 TaxID=1450539 RepID=A0A318ZQE5_9EURO|nr:hypothetical protein BP01DRAFT_379246 [Aspergillus saccharolyticus JOP 1030-1]PYH48855.1 hypothetical protein BP01DRAFT_379246 [Aspergillus saccharolyticus JOP 1030-1]